MLARAQKNPKLKRLVDDVRVFANLKEHEGWQRLYETFQEQRASLMLTLARRLMAGTEVTPEDIAYHRGYFRGVRDVLERPMETVESLESAALKAAEEIAWERLSEIEGEEPYN